ncbi:NPL4 family, putative zinc binding region-domain-containing protein, partial [Lenzites betulinus]
MPIQLIRVRHKEGNFRFEFQPTSDISDLLAKILETASDADPSTVTISNQPRGNEVLVSTLKGKTLQSLGLKCTWRPALCELQRAACIGSTGATTSTNAPASDGQDTSKRTWEVAEEDTVDKYWRAQEGKIPRGRDSRFCKHGANAMCDYCMPLEPYDAAYHKEHNIKHLSYTHTSRKSHQKHLLRLCHLHPAPAQPALVQSQGSLSYRRHQPWPAGICTACQPS